MKYCRAQKNFLTDIETKSTDFRSYRSHKFFNQITLL